MEHEPLRPLPPEPTPAPTGQPPRTPLLLVHGYLATRELMLPLRNRLRQEGVWAQVSELPPLLLGDMEALALRLADEVRRLAGAGPAPLQYDLLGVSMGGLLCLRALQGAPEPLPVRRFVAVGTPFSGSPLAPLAHRLLGWVSPAAAQMRRGHAFNERLQREGLPAGVPTLTISGSHDPVAPPAACRLAGAQEAQVYVRGLPALLSHQGLLISDEVVRRIVGFLRQTGD